MSQAPSRAQDQDIDAVGFAPANDDIIFLDPEEMIADEDFEFVPEDSQAQEAIEDVASQNRVNLEQITREVESVSGYVIKKKEETRGILALTYIRATFLVFFLGFFVSILDGVINQSSIVANLEKLLPIISGIFLGTLGFVIGYYFRKDEEER